MLKSWLSACFYIYRVIIERVNMGDLSVNKIQQQQINTNGVSAPQVQAQTSSLGLEKKNELVALAEKLGITVDQLNNILGNNPDFLTLNPEKQAEIASALTVKSETVQAPEQNIEAAETTDNTTVADNTDDNTLEVSPDKYDFRKFSELPLEKQFDVYAEELAKNKFLYGSEQKQISDWEALSEEEKLSKISAEKKELDKNDPKYAPQNKGDEKSLSKWVEAKMVTLQAANFDNMSIEAFNSLESNDKNVRIHDYFMNAVLNNTDDDGNLKQDATCTDQQFRYIKRQQYLSKIVLDAAMQSGDSSLNNANTEDFILPKEELERYCKQIGKPVAQIEYEYLKQKSSSGKLSEEEQKRFERLKRFDTPAGKEVFAALKNPQNYGIMEDLKKSEFGEDWKAVEFASDEDKKLVLHNYISKKMKSLPQSERSKFFNEFISEYSTQDPLLANDLATICLIKSGKNERKQLVQGATELLNQYFAMDINNLSPEAQKEIAEKQNALQKENPELYSLLAQTVTQIADEGSFESFREGYLKSNDKVLLTSLVNRAYDTKRSSQVGQQKILLGVFENPDAEIRKQAAIRLDEAYKENQIPLTQAAIQHKDCNDAMIENGTFTRFAEENQVEAFKLHKARCENDDYSKDEAIRNLNKLSDWIPEVKNADNQLAMHNDIMGSKYSEVQEHAAGNIKNYAPSVQAAAMDTVYSSGNQKAIDTAVANMTSYKSEAVMQQEYPRVFGEAVLQSGAEFQEKFLNGSLSLQEISQLTSTERREYFAELFKKASPEQKIKWLSKMSDGTQKKTVYTFIALYDQNLLGRMVESGLGLEMFNICNDVKAQNKIFAVMDRSENETVKQQCASIKNDPRNAGLFIGKTHDTDPKTAHTLNNNYASVPFDGFNLFKRQDKLGRSYLNA